jgi:hypothetical protein
MASQRPCLCLFDVDRTLTGKQKDTHHCPHNKVFASIHDPGFHGGPLTVSNLGQHLDKTFCVRCYAGVISHGSAGGSKMRSELVKLLNKGKPRYLWVKNTWHNIDKHSAANSVDGPLVAGVINSHKHRVAASIHDWYRNHMKIDIQIGHIHFFDDMAANVEEFQKSGYNAYQVSCKSRDNSHGKDDHIGYCGGTVAECVSASGAHLCPKRDEGAIHMPTFPEDTGLVPAGMIAATDGLQEPSEEEEIGQSPTAEDAALAPAEMITATNGPQELSEEEEIERSPTAQDAALAPAKMITATNSPQELSRNASALMWGGLASVEVIV